jgi:hypothetical protein
MDSILAHQTVGVMGSGTDEHEAPGQEITALRPRCRCES